MSGPDLCPQDDPGLSITEYLTTCNYAPGGPNRSIEYLVLHYVGATGTAMQNAQFYHGQYRGASAHYFVDFDGSIVRVVRDRDVAWHCGTRGTYRHPRCRNQNSIGIELCVRNRGGNTAATDKDAGWYFEPATLRSAQRLVRALMDRYRIPIEGVLRHYDVTGKLCPAPFCNGQMDWSAFLAGVADLEQGTQEPDQAAGEPSPWAADACAWAQRQGLVTGDTSGQIHWHSPVTLEQTAVLLSRLAALQDVGGAADPRRIPEPRRYFHR